MAKRFRGKSPEKYAKVDKIRKQSRKKTHAADLMTEFVRDENSWDELNEGDWFGARVVEVHKRYCFVSVEKTPGEVDTKDVWMATVARRYLVAERGERNFVAVGDRVLCSPTPADKTSDDLPSCVIQHLAPRTSKIARLDPHTQTRLHVLAANADLLLIVASYAKPKVKWGLIDRYIVLAESEQIPVAIVLNKVDLFDEMKPATVEEAKERLETYRSLGYDVFTFQANHDEAAKNDEIRRLGQLLAGRFTLLSGHSGVGKSSIVNLFDPEIVQAVEPDEDIFYKGRHTTTFASFLKLRNVGSDGQANGFCIDTPGIRSFTFPDMSAIDLTACFVEMKPFLGQCQYRECRHIDEPDCKVLEAREQGVISEWRYQSYVAILLGASGREGRMREMEEP